MIFFYEEAWWLLIDICSSTLKSHVIIKYLLVLRMSQLSTFIHTCVLESTCQLKHKHYQHNWCKFSQEVCLNYQVVHIIRKEFFANTANFVVKHTQPILNCSWRSQTKMSVRKCYLLKGIVLHLFTEPIQKIDHSQFTYPVWKIVDMQLSAFHIHKHIQGWFWLKIRSSGNWIQPT